MSDCGYTAKNRGVAQFPASGRESGRISFYEADEK